MRRPWAFLALRYGIGGVLVLAGVVVLIINPGGFGVDGFALAVGSGLSVLMLNILFRLGVSGDRERDLEERARAYLDKFGRWPDEDEAASPELRARARAFMDGEDEPPP
ncbi:MAG: hypothetical protein WAK93_14720 [Solirubrobacteraceae bacterium]